MAARRTLTAYTLFEALMRAVGSEDGEEAAMDVDGVELTAAKLLGSQEPSKDEEDMWFHERSRCGTCSVLIILLSPDSRVCSLPATFSGKIRCSGSACDAQFRSLVAEGFRPLCRTCCPLSLERYIIF